KLHGNRIELGEIEAVLLQHPSVREAIAVIREDGEEERRGLVAYVTSSMATTPSELRNFVASRLPHYMVPSSIVPLDVIRLNANGKVERRALPAPRPPLRPAGARPCTPTEEILAGLWRDLLGTGEVSRDDDFFALGGQSMLAMRLVSQVRETFSIELPLAMV